MCPVLSTGGTAANQLSSGCTLARHAKAIVFYAGRVTSATRGKLYSISVSGTFYMEYNYCYFWQQASVSVRRTGILQKIRARSDVTRSWIPACHPESLGCYCEKPSVNETSTSEQGLQLRRCILPEASSGGKKK